MPGGYQAFTYVAPASRFLDRGHAGTVEHLAKGWFRTRRTRRAGELYGASTGADYHRRVLPVQTLLEELTATGASRITRRRDLAGRYALIAEQIRELQ